MMTPDGSNIGATGSNPYRAEKNIAIMTTKRLVKARSPAAKVLPRRGRFTYSQSEYHDQ